MYGKLKHYGNLGEFVLILITSRFGADPMVSFALPKKRKKEKKEVVYHYIRLLIKRKLCSIMDIHLARVSC